jgi:aminoglycoside phosphotransferase (APT) family kinase protein
VARILHRSFQEIAERVGVPGLPDFLRRRDVTATYRELTGYEPADMDWYETYAALRFAIIMFRITRRAVHFGETEMPAIPTTPSAIGASSNACSPAPTSLAPP